jgi:hypothetical protein
MPGDAAKKVNAAAEMDRFATIASFGPKASESFQLWIV